MQEKLCIVREKVKHKTIIILLLYIFATNNCIGERSMIHIANVDNKEVISCNESIYYIINSKSIFGDRAELCKYHNGVLTEISKEPHYSMFEGCYLNRILICFVDKSFTNYPEKRHYSLFDPLTNIFSPLPDSIEEYLSENTNIVIKAIDNLLFVKKDNMLLYYCEDKDELLPVLSMPIDFVGFASTWIYARSADKCFLIYGIESSLIIKEISTNFPEICIRIPNTNDIYFVNDLQEGSALHHRDLQSLKEDVVLFDSRIGRLMLSIDSHGQYLYYQVSESENGYLIKRYDIYGDYEDNYFTYFLSRPEDGYIKDILIQNNEIICLVSHGAKEDRIEIFDMSNI